MHGIEHAETVEVGDEQPVLDESTEQCITYRTSPDIPSGYMSRTDLHPDLHLNYSLEHHAARLEPAARTEKDPTVFMQRNDQSLSASPKPSSKPWGIATG